MSKGKRVLRVVAVLVLLFVVCGCGVVQCGASVHGDVTQNAPRDDGAWGIWGLAALVFVLMLLICALSSIFGGLGGGRGPQL